jgi:precorrin-2 dehydrogenase/sirohydrochlorin ferrochelatase
VRRDLELLFDEDFRSFLDWLAALRDDTKEAEPDAGRRRARLKEAVDGFRITGKLEYPKAWLEEKARRQAGSSQNS